MQLIATFFGISDCLFPNEVNEHSSDTELRCEDLGCEGNQEGRGDDMIACFLVSELQEHIKLFRNILKLSSCCYIRICTTVEVVSYLSENSLMRSELGSRHKLLYICSFIKGYFDHILAQRRACFLFLDVKTTPLQ